MKPAGFEASQGIISSAYLKDTSDPQWKDDAGMKAFDEFLTKYFPEGNRIDGSVMFGYTVAQGLVHVLKACGDDLTRENVMKQAANIKGSSARWPVAGHQGQHLADRLRADLAGPAAEVQGRSLGVVRRDHERRRRRLVISNSDRPICGPEAPPRLAAGVFFWSDWMDNQTSRR